MDIGAVKFLKKLTKLRNNIATAFRRVSLVEQKDWLGVFETDPMYPQLVAIHKNHIGYRARKVLDQLLLLEESIKSEYQNGDAQSQTIWYDTFNEVNRTNVL